MKPLKNWVFFKITLNGDGLVSGKAVLTKNSHLQAMR
jgi:hypothetical protein